MTDLGKTSCSFLAKCIGEQSCISFLLKKERILGLTSDLNIIRLHLLGAHMQKRCFRRLHTCPHPEAGRGSGEEKAKRAWRWVGGYPQTSALSHARAGHAPNLALAPKPTSNSRPLFTTTNARPESPKEAGDWASPWLPR